ncbi:Transposon protein, putative, CACTA, En/Spm sub-class [Hordeum vulgare]|nr:Transposon protein, putative, CACTA, En/Spm sub-class [Hordeum vulgare]
MCCPCAICENDITYSKSRVIRVHLFTSSFMLGYNCWTKHGERGVLMEENEEEEDDDTYPMFCEYDGTTMGEEGEEEAPDEPADDLGRAIAYAKRNCASEKEKLKLQRMLEDHKRLLYPNCKDDKKKLGTTLELLQWKAENGVCDKGFENLRRMLKKMLPKDNEFLDDTYEAKKAICPLGLEVQ